MAQTRQKRTRVSEMKPKPAASTARTTRTSRAAVTPVKPRAAAAYPTPPASVSSRSTVSNTTPSKAKGKGRMLIIEDASGSDSESDDESEMLKARRTAKGKRKRDEEDTPTVLVLPSPPLSREASVEMEEEVVFVVPSMPDDKMEEDHEISEVLIPPSPAKTPASAKRKRAFVPARKEETSDEEDDDLVIGDENRPMSPIRAGELEEVIEPHRTRFPSQMGVRLLQSVADVIYSRATPPALVRDTPKTRAELAAIPCLPCLEQWEGDVRLQLDRTIRDGEGNCMVLLGPRGVGKSAIIERSLSLLEAAHGSEGFITIRLSGMTSTTDRATLREIARQLCSDEGGIDDDGASFTSHAMILQSLLTLLEPEPSTASASKSLDRSKPIIFILEEFDRFAERDDRQSFLYCLLDIVQSKRRKGGMAVIGVSSRVDCLDRLEKRVRSRCQSRVLRICPPATLTDFTSVARTLLRCEEDESELAEAWNSGIEAFLAEDEVQRAFKDLFDLRANVGELLQNLGEMINHHAHAISHGRTFALPCLQAKDLPILRPSIERFGLATMPQVCVAVLIAAKHVTASSPKPFFTPAALWERYYRHARSEAASKQRPFPLAVFTRALEHLCAIEAIVDASPTSATGTISASAAAQLTSPWRRLRLVVWSSELDPIVKGRKDLPAHLRQWNIHG